MSKEKLLQAPAATARMDDETLERFVKQYIEGVTGDSVVFSWQGGEPALLRLEFFRKVVALEKKYAKPGQKIENDLQTNGTLITEEWWEFLKANRFLVGLSIDGPRDIHDHYRVTKGNKPTFDKVLNAARLLRRYGVPFNTLTCVHHFNAKRPLDVYRFLRKSAPLISSSYPSLNMRASNRARRRPGCCKVTQSRRSRSAPRTPEFYRDRLVGRSR